MIILIIILCMVQAGNWNVRTSGKDTRGTLLFSGILEMCFEFALLLGVTKC